MKMDSNKSKNISVRVTETEYDLIDEKTRISGLNRSEYIVKTCLQNQEKQEPSLEMIDFLEMMQEYLII